MEITSEHLYRLRQKIGAAYVTGHALSDSRIRVKVVMVGPGGVKESIVDVEAQPDEASFISAVEAALAATASGSST